MQILSNTLKVMCSLLIHRIIAAFRKFPAVKQWRVSRFSCSITPVTGTCSTRRSPETVKEWNIKSCVCLHPKWNISCSKNETFHWCRMFRSLKCSDGFLINASLHRCDAAELLLHNRLWKCLMSEDVKRKKVKINRKLISLTHISVSVCWISFLYTRFFNLTGDLNTLFCYRVLDNMWTWSLKLTNI